MNSQDYWPLAKTVFLENAAIVSLIVIWLTSLLLTSLGTIIWMSQRSQLHTHPSSSLFVKVNFSIKSSSCSALIGRYTSSQEIIGQLTERGCADYTEYLTNTTSKAILLFSSHQSDVYLMELTDGSKVAIKCLRKFLDAGSDVRKDLKRAGRELYIWSKLDHENVHKLLGLANFRDHIALISPWMANGTLDKCLGGKPGHPKMCLEVAKGLAYMHEQGVIHGDLKTPNVLISEDRTIKITDFGSASSSACSLRFTRTASVPFTLRWAAPELLSGEDEITPTIPTTKSDVYALGMTFLEIFTGALPYYDLTDTALLRMAGTPTSRPYPRTPSTLKLTEQPCWINAWQLLIECWADCPELRPTAARVRNIFSELLKATCEQSQERQSVTHEDWTILSIPAGSHGRQLPCAVHLYEEAKPQLGLPPPPEHSSKSILRHFMPCVPRSPTSVFMFTNTYDNMHWPSAKNWAGSGADTDIRLPSASTDLKHMKYWVSHFGNLETVEAHEEAREETIRRTLGDLGPSPHILFLAGHTIQRGDESCYLSSDYSDTDQSAPRYGPSFSEIRNLLLENRNPTPLLLVTDFCNCDNILGLPYVLREESGGAYWEMTGLYASDQRTSIVNIIHFAGAHEHTADESGQRGGTFTRAFCTISPYRSVTLPELLRRVREDVASSLAPYHETRPGSSEQSASPQIYSSGKFDLCDDRVLQMFGFLNPVV